MSARIEVIADSYLAEWARWAGHETRSLGYPWRSITEKAGEGGINAGSPRPPIEIPPDVARTDAAVAKIRQRNKSILWRAIRIRYLERAPIESIEASMRVSRSEAYRLLNRALRAVFFAREAE